MIKILCDSESAKIYRHCKVYSA